MEIKLPSKLTSTRRSPFMKWLLEGHVDEPEGPHQPENTKEHKHKTHPWWQVMCLTGVDYFSTLGYQPFIAYQEAGYLSPFATIILVILTLVGAYPVYAKVAKDSPHGEGSISMLQKLLSWWQGKLFVLMLLGFAATAWIITITLSAADAAVHVIENQFVKETLHLHLEGKEVLVTSILILSLAGVFLKGFKEAVMIAVALVVFYLGMNIVVIGAGLAEVFSHPEVLSKWQQNISTPKTGNGNPLKIFLLAQFISG